MLNSIREIGCRGTEGATSQCKIGKLKQIKHIYIMGQQLYGQLGHQTGKPVTRQQLLQHIELLLLLQNGTQWKCSETLDVQWSDA